MIGHWITAPAVYDQNALPQLFYQRIVVLRLSLRGRCVPRRRFVVRVRSDLLPQRLVVDQEGEGSRCISSTWISMLL